MNTTSITKSKTTTARLKRFQLVLCQTANLAARLPLVSKAAQVAIVAVLFVSTILTASGQTQVASQDWNFARNFTLTAAGSSGTANTSLIDDLEVSRYTGTLDLLRVRIFISQPLSTESELINATIAVGANSTTFSSSTTNNRLQETTLLPADGMSFYSDLDDLGAAPLTYSQVRSSANYASQTLTHPDTLSRSIDLTTAAFLVFDSDDFTLSSAQLNSVFRDAGDLFFGLELTTTFRYQRDNSEQLTAAFVGSNSGSVVVEYYAVPEPSGAALAGMTALGVAAVILRLRARSRRG